MNFDFGDEDKRSDNFNLINRQTVFDQDDLKTEQTQSLYKWWLSFAPGLPRRQDFDIVEHRHLSSHIYLLEVLSPTEFLYRLNGETVISLIGRSLRNQIVSPESTVHEDRLFARYLCELLRIRTACRCHGDLSALDREFVKFESLDCPIADEAGKITHIIGVIASR